MIYKGLEDHGSMVDELEESVVLVVEMRLDCMPLQVDQLTLFKGAINMEDNMTLAIISI